MERRPQPMTPARLRRERRTMAAMIDLYCHEKHGCCHGPGRSCGPCGELLAYALARLSHCPFGRHKPTCSRCPIHCYRPEWRERVREVMRFAGPRLLLHRPLLALTHLLDGLRPKNP